ncbi:endosialidase [[Clostridium] symbiosum]|uniref:endosialidase n=1 Tax=Clostridium symbiosum TaxID=1512 RepID=UPI00321A0E57
MYGGAASEAWGFSELIRIEDDGTISFGNYELATKSKLQDFEYKGDLYKVKTFHEITKLERNGMFVYESVPGTAVNHFAVDDSEVTFAVEGNQDAQITVQLEDDREYEVFIDGIAVGGMTTNVSGKLVLSVELNEGVRTEIRIAGR